MTRIDVCDTQYLSLTDLLLRDGKLKRENLVLSNALRKVELPPWKMWKADVSSVNIDSDETSAFQIFHGENSPFIDLFDKTKFTCH